MRIRFAPRGLVVTSVWAAILIGFLKTPRVPAQSATTDWEKAAGGKMSFDVASVKQNKSNEQGSTGLPLGGPESAPVNGGLFSATNLPVAIYISVAYKLNIVQVRSLAAQLPKWANDDRFDIQGRGSATATRAQMRLMLQSLLADRFNFKGHFETRQTRVYALVLSKPGVMGPKLQKHSDGPPCPDTSKPSTGQNALASPPSGLPEFCDQVIAWADSRTGIGYAGRRISMRSIAENLPSTPDTSFDRPVIDRTELVGDFDFVVKFSSESEAGAQTAFLEALKDQLGLKLESTTGPAESFIIDHIE